MSEDVGMYCKKCYIKKHKLSKEKIEHLVFFNLPEQCDCCGKIEKLVDYVREENEA